MKKVRARERWKKHIDERFIALEQSGELKKLRRKGLVILGRRTLLSTEEWWRTSSERLSSLQYQEFYGGCKALGERFGLASWIVEMACLLRGYRPAQNPYVMEADWPRVTVVTDSADRQFVARLAFEAQRLGIYVVQRCGSAETKVLYLHSVPIAALEPPLLPSSMPPVYSALRVRVEVPPRYPPEAAKELQTEAGKLAKELLRRLGYSVPQRLRTSPLVAMADQLKVAKAPLAMGETYEIADRVFGEGDLADDQRRRKVVSSRRYKLRKRLVEQYEPDT